MPPWRQGTEDPWRGGTEDPTGPAALELERTAIPHPSSSISSTATSPMLSVLACHYNGRAYSFIVCCRCGRIIRQNQFYWLYKHYRFCTDCITRILPQGTQENPIILQ